MVIHIATQEVFAHTDAKVEIWGLVDAHAERSLVKQAGSERYGVTLTDTVGVVKPAKTIYGNVQVTGITQPGVGNEDVTSMGTHAVGVALDGTWEFEGIVSTGTTPAPTTTPQGTVVYAEPDGDLTLEDGGGANFRIGPVNYPGTYAKVAGTLPIQIGA